ncbi:MAG: hypothetical protein ACTSRI_17600 [Promethearchaeota archaeon]
MIDKLKSKLEELALKKKELAPKIEELKEKKIEEIQDIEQKYEHLFLDATYNVDKFERDLFNEFIKAFTEVVIEEVNMKRSTDMYTITNKIKEYNEYFSTVDMFPKELVEKLDKVISEENQIESIAYEIDDIERKYLKSE